MTNIFGKLFKSNKVKTIPNYQNWRHGIYTVTPEMVGVSKDTPNYIYAVIMDIGLADDMGCTPTKGNLVITMTAFASGESSLMPSWAGGLIGLGNNDEINTIAKQIVSDAQSHYDLSKPVVDHTHLPVSGLALFYFLTTSGVRIVECTLKDLYAGNHPFSQTFAKFTNIKQIGESLKDKYSNQIPNS